MAGHWDGCYFTWVDVLLLQLECPCLIGFIISWLRYINQPRVLQRTGFWWSWDAHSEFADLPSCFSPIYIRITVVCSSSIIHIILNFLKQDAICHPFEWCITCGVGVIFFSQDLCSVLWRSLQWYPFYECFSYGHLSSDFRVITMPPYIIYILLY